MRALVVGRFQPFHLGHRALIQKAVEECVEVGIAIGSPEAKPSPRNPFSFAERKQMVHAVFPALTVYAIPDLHDPTRWVEHALSLTGPVERIYGNDRETTDLFDAAGYSVVAPGLVERNHYEATAIRAQIAADDPAWRKAVPKEVAKLLDEWNAGARLRKLA